MFSPLRAGRFALLGAALTVSACQQKTTTTTVNTTTPDSTGVPSVSARLAMYKTVRLSADLTKLSAKERQMLPILMEAAELMNPIFWRETYGDPDSLLSRLTDPDMRRFAEINFGPYDRLRGNEPFVPGVGPKSAGANYYPADLTQADFETYIAAHPDSAARFKSQYTLIRRRADGELYAVPYHVAFAPYVTQAATKLREAAALAEDAGLKRYLLLRADALLTDNYQPSDLAWMDMKSNQLDLVIGPIESYEDGLSGTRAAHEAYVLVKDREWSARLSKYAALLPKMQQGLPVPAAYRAESPGANSDLGAYDALLYAGEANTGGKTIAINLPNDEEVQLRKGSRRLQLKNVMRAKFDAILVPIADELIADDQRQHVTFDAFFATVMFHEVAHGLGIKNLVGKPGMVRAAMKDVAGGLEEGKADVLGLYLITKLKEMGELPEGVMEDYYVTFMASIFRSIRFGAADAHGVANMVRFNFFEQQGAFARDPQTGKYRVDMPKMRAAMDSLSAKILTFQGDGDYDGVVAMNREMGVIRPALQAELDKIARAGIPVDLLFEQGPATLGR